MPTEIWSSLAKNRLYVRLDGFLAEDEAAQALNKILAEIAKLSPGFDVITDARGFKPGSPKVADVLMRAQKAYKEKGKRVVRIVKPDDVLGKMQLQRTASASGLDTPYVTTMEEAERLLDG